MTVDLEKTSSLADKLSETQMSENSAEKNMLIVHAALKRLSAADTTGRPAIAKAVTSQFSAVGLKTCIDTCQIFSEIETLATNKKSADARESALSALLALSEAFGRCFEPFLIQQLPLIFELAGDRTTFVRESAEAALSYVRSHLTQFSLKAVMPTLFDTIEHAPKWQSKVAALQFLSSLVQVSSTGISVLLPEIVPVVSAAMWDSKPEVQQRARETMMDVCKEVGNPDIVPALPALIGCIINPEEVPECVHTLAATTFVSQVEAPALAIMCPLLTRALADRAPTVFRQAAVIIDNMCKLVENPQHASQFLPSLLPGLDRIIETAASPEVRTVATRARATMVRVGGGEAKKAEETAIDHEKLVRDKLDSMFPEHSGKTMTGMINYISIMGGALAESGNFDANSWKQVSQDYLVPHIVSESKGSTIGKDLSAYFDKLKKSMDEQAAAGAEEEEGEELCNCEFSLAYGGMILLNNTKLHLRRGQRYGLCGPNGSGKTTLMRAIAEGKLEGFPSPDVLRTVFVEHSLQASEADMGVADFIHSDPHLQSMGIDKIRAALADVGFTSAMQDQAVGSLSGGWKMKLELCRAMLMKADILMLDEPTNHLDVSNVKWLIDYLNSRSDVTCLIVSHDSGFLDSVCTHIIHYESRKLKSYRGNLSEFVKQRPEAKSYYELSSETHTMMLPEPAFLDGVKSKDKAILKLTNCSYVYPGTDKTAVEGITIQCSLNSRIAVVGPNGAGKSTIIKMLTGETIPTTGDLVKHPNLQVAYVAQHAFHHLEKFLDKTANEYIRWRYQYGEDRELLEKASRQVSDEEKKQMEVKVLYEGQKLQIENLYGRRKTKRSFEYEVKWVGLAYEDNAWIERETLEQWGFGKMVQKFDDREAAKAGGWTRPLTAANVEKQLADLGLESEFSTHNRIRGLSGGQKVKVVIAAAMWLKPQLIVLDEPTNYLDRDSLAALAEALRNFGGGVVVISHHQQFVSEVCKETWHVNAGRLTIEGAATTAAGAGEKIEMKEETVNLDAFGNVSKVKSTKKLSRKEQKAKERRRANAIKNGEPVSSDDEY